MSSSKTSTSVSELIESKNELKSKLKNNFPTALKEHLPIIGILYDHKNDSLAFSLVEAMSNLNMPIMLIAEQESEKIPFDLREKVCAVSKKSKNWEKFYYACDIMITLTEVDEKTFRDMHQNGIIPIASKSHKTLSNYDPNHETGNSFVFDEKNIWEVFAATIRATETYKFPYDWKNIIKSAL